MAGFWHLSHHQMRDPNGAVLAGAKAYFFKSDSLLPIIVYQDYGLGTPHPNPVQANGYGIFPPVFFDEEDAFYRQRITTSSGLVIPGSDVGTLPIIGPSGGGGGSEVPVDANALLKTGYPLWLPLSGSWSGFVRMNGRTIGSAISGASERANADCEQLYAFNWNNFTDTLCPVTGGRGLTAAADWSANKPITLLNMRNKGPFGLDDMGNSPAGGFTGITFDVGDATTPGSVAGRALHTLVTGEMPTHKHTLNESPHSHEINPAENVLLVSSGGFGYGAGSLVATPRTETASAKTNITMDNVGSGQAHNNMPPFMLGTWYQRLAIAGACIPILLESLRYAVA